MILKRPRAQYICQKQFRSRKSGMGTWQHMNTAHHGSFRTFLFRRNLPLAKQFMTAFLPSVPPYFSMRPIHLCEISRDYITTRRLIIGGSLYLVPLSQVLYGWMSVNDGPRCHVRICNNILPSTIRRPFAIYRRTIYATAEMEHCQC